MEGKRTVYIALEVLAAYLARKRADSRLLVEFTGDGVLVVAEEAVEGCCEGFALVGGLAAADGGGGGGGGDGDGDVPAWGPWACETTSCVYPIGGVSWLGRGGERMARTIVGGETRREDAFLEGW